MRPRTHRSDDCSRPMRPVTSTESWQPSGRGGLGGKGSSIEMLEANRGSVPPSRPSSRLIPTWVAAEARAGWWCGCTFYLSSRL